MRERGCIDAWKYIKFESTPVKDPPPLHLKCILLFCTLINFYTEFTFTVSGCFPTPDRAETHTHIIYFVYFVSVFY